MTNVSAFKTMTIQDGFQNARRKLKAAGIDGADRVAQHVIEAATDLSAEQIMLRANEPLARDVTVKVHDILSRACNFEPVSRIVNRREFYGRVFELNEATLDPRPDSETLIDAALELADDLRWKEKPINLIDVGTGSGCLAITLLAELPNARAVVTDISDRALAATKYNAENLGVADRLSSINRDGLADVSGTFDLLISNPPYIRSCEIPDLSPQVRNYDPHRALDGGRDGLTMYRAIASQIERVVPSGWVLFEVGAKQADDVIKILNSAPITLTRTWNDLSGHTRCVAAQTHCA